MTTQTHKTVADLYQVADGQKAELVDGEVVWMAPTGGKSGYAGDAVLVSLWTYARQNNSGHAVGDNKGFVVNLPNRQTFSPDAAFYLGSVNTEDFLMGAPIFAVEVRSKWDRGVTAERAMAAKRTDYFAAGSSVVWDVDLQSLDVVRVYRATAPTVPTLYRRGDRAEAEPAVPGWTMSVDDLFPQPNGDQL